MTTTIYLQDREMENKNQIAIYCEDKSISSNVFLDVDDDEDIDISKELLMDESSILNSKKTDNEDIDLLSLNTNDLIFGTDSGSRVEPLICTMPDDLNVNKSLDMSNYFGDGARRKFFMHFSSWSHKMKTCGQGINSFFNNKSKPCLISC